MKIKSHYERVLSQIYARSLCENNQQKCIDCLKPRSNKNELDCQNVVAMNFMSPIIKAFHFEYWSFCNV